MTLVNILIIIEILNIIIGDVVRISKYKNIFAKRYNPNWCEEMFVIKRYSDLVIKSTNPWSYVLNDLNREETVGTFYENELQRTN